MQKFYCILTIRWTQVTYEKERPKITSSSSLFSKLIQLKSIRPKVFFCAIIKMHFIVYLLIYHDFLPFDVYNFMTQENIFIICFQNSFFLCTSVLPSFFFITVNCTFFLKKSLYYKWGCFDIEKWITIKKGKNDLSNPYP